MAKNFEDVGVTNDDSSQFGEKKINDAKKLRTRKYVIHDSVNIRKLSFEEKTIIEVDSDVIIKSFSPPSRINPLQKMKDYFSKKVKPGKTLIPKKLLSTSEHVTPNFGDSLIYDYDDEKEIVGSRKDFTCFSYYINNFTGELQGEVNYSLQIRFDEDQSLQADMNLDNLFTPNFSRPSTPFSNETRIQSPLNWLSPPRSPSHSISENVDRESLTCDHNIVIEKNSKDDLSHLNIDEGIEVDDFDKSNILLPESPNLSRIFSFEPTSIIIPSTKDTQSVENLKDLVQSDFTEKEVEEKRIINLFMIPMKKLKHKCAFSLPNEEYRELKRRKKEHYKFDDNSLSKQIRVFNPFEMFKEANSGTFEQVRNAQLKDEEEFFGFTKHEQIIASNFFEKTPPFNYITQSLYNNKSLDIIESDTSRKSSNDSGFDDNCEEMSSINLINSSELALKKNSIDLDITEECISDVNINNDSYINESIQISGTDSCYQSLASGESTKTELSSFFRDIESRNKEINEREEIENQEDEETLKAYEERVQVMQQNAMNVS